MNLNELYEQIGQLLVKGHGNKPVVVITEFGVNLITDVKFLGNTIELDYDCTKSIDFESQVKIDPSIPPTEIHFKQEDKPVGKIINLLPYRPPGVY